MFWDKRAQVEPETLEIERAQVRQITISKYVYGFVIVNILSTFFFLLNLDIDDNFISNKFFLPAFVAPVIVISLSGIPNWLPLGRSS